MSVKFERDTIQQQFQQQFQPQYQNPTSGALVPVQRGGAPPQFSQAPQFQVPQVPQGQMVTANPNIPTNIASNIPSNLQSNLPSNLQSNLPSNLADSNAGPIRRALEGAPPLPGTSGKHPVAEAIGTALTGGKKMAGTKGYLATYIKELESNPLRTKMLTAGTLAGAQEFIASWLAKDRNKHGNYFTSRVPKMAAYGALISAPLGHFLIWLLQRLFKGRVSLRAKILQIVVSNLVIAPIQNSIYLVAMAIIAGARTFHQVRATVKVGFWRVMRVSWLTSPICLAFAQQFLPDELWVPFFNLVSFIIGTYINTVTKKKRLAALRKKHFGDNRDNRDPRDNRPPNMGGRPEDYPPPPMGPNPQY